MTTTVDPTASMTVNGWNGQAEFGELDRGVFVLTMADTVLREVRVVFNENASPAYLARSIVLAVARILDDTGPEAADAAAHAAARILGDQTDAVLAELHAMPEGA